MSKLKDEVAGISSPWYRPLGAEGVKKIADAAMEILSRSGMAVYSDASREALLGAGAEVGRQSHIIRMPRSMVEDAIDSNPSSITLYSRDGQSDQVLQKDHVHYGTGGTAIYVLDPDTG